MIHAPGIGGIEDYGCGRVQAPQLRGGRPTDDQSISLVSAESLRRAKPAEVLEAQFFELTLPEEPQRQEQPGTALGEVPIVAYSLGQARSTGVRAPAMALCVLLLHMALRRTDQFQPAVRLAAEWMRRGEQTRGYATHRLEDWMDRPVSEVRSLVLAAA